MLAVRARIPVWVAESLRPRQKAVAAEEVDTHFVEEGITHRRVELQELAVALAVLVLREYPTALLGPFVVGPAQVLKPQPRAEDAGLGLFIAIALFKHHALVGLEKGQNGNLAGVPGDTRRRVQSTNAQE